MVFEFEFQSERKLLPYDEQGNSVFKRLSVGVVIFYCKQFLRWEKLDQTSDHSQNLVEVIFKFVRSICNGVAVSGQN